MKYINIINIHSEKRFLKEFIKDLNNKKGKFIEKRDINQKDLLVNYKKWPLLLDNKIPNYKYSFLSNNIA